MYVTSDIQLAGMWLNMQLAQSISVLLSIASGFVHLCTQLVKKGKKNADHELLPEDDWHLRSWLVWRGLHSSDPDSNSYTMKWRVVRNQYNPKISYLHLVLFFSKIVDKQGLLEIRQNHGTVTEEMSNWLPDQQLPREAQVMLSKCWEFSFRDPGGYLAVHLATDQGIEDKDIWEREVAGIDSDQMWEVPLSED